MNNLLSNAIKYTDEGSVELGIKCERDHNKIWMTIKVSDTGRGIRKEDIDKLFMDYSQLDLESNRQMEGTGLGLPITKNLTEMMNGSISVESDHGKGSVFTVKILQQFVTDTTISREVVENLKSFHYSNEKRDCHKKIKRFRAPYARVLVVDDNITNLDVAKGLMKPYGMQIDSALGGQEAIDLIRSEKNRYDAIFMDHMMPGLDGVEATRIIREEIGTEYAKNIPIVALTANAISGNETLFLSKGFQAFITKPIDIKRLDTVIRQLVRDKTKEKTYEESTDEDKLPGKRIFEDIIIPGLDIPSGIERFNGDEKEYLDILRSFADNTAPILEKIKNVEKDTLSDYAIIVHGIKGASKGIAAGPVGEFAEQMEKMAKAGNYDYVYENNKKLILCVENLIKDIKTLLKNTDETNVRPKKTNIDRVLNNTRKKIILVDDVMANLDQGKSMLRAYYEVYAVLSAAKMFEILEKITPALILLDIEMPEMDGYDAIKKLKADERYADIPVIFLTARTDANSEVEGLNLGAVDYVTKPFSAPMLLKRIEKELLLAEQRK